MSEYNAIGLMVRKSIRNANTYANMDCKEKGPMRFGLCCLFKDEEIAFRTTTAKVLSTLPRDEQLKKLSLLRQCPESRTVQRLCIGAILPLVVTEGWLGGRQS